MDIKMSQKAKQRNSWRLVPGKDDNDDEVLKSPSKPNLQIAWLGPPLDSNQQ